MDISMQLNKKRAKCRRLSMVVRPHGGKSLKGPLVLVQAFSRISGPWYVEWPYFYFCWVEQCLYGWVKLGVAEIKLKRVSV